MTTDPIIDPAHCDNRLHAAPYEGGRDFNAKYEAHRADGFLVALDGPNRRLLVAKVMQDDPIPPLGDLDSPTCPRRRKVEGGFASGGRSRPEKERTIP